MTRLSTLGIGLLSHAAGLARGFEPLSHGEAETAALTAGLGQCGPFPPGPLDRTNPTCAPSLIEDFGTDPADWHPWTHRPYCADTPYCVFTNAHFHGNNGISIITTPALAAHTLDTIESTFASPFRQAFLDPEGGPAYEVRDIPGKGKGAVAARTIRKGERFMVDYAGVIADAAFPTQLKMMDGKKLLEAAVDQLPRMDKIRDLARSGNTEARMVEDLLRTNSFGVTVEERKVMALFPEISRMNHACNPNVFTRFSEKTFAMTALAMRDIEPGEELTISYTQFGLTRPERQKQLLTRWGFKCTCTLCAAAKPATLASDARRERMRELRDKVVGHVHSGETREAITSHMEMLDIIAEEEMLSPLGEHYEILARLYGVLRDRKSAAKWVERAIEDMEMFGGVEEYDQIPELEAFLRDSRK